MRGAHACTPSLLQGDTLLKEEQAWAKRLGVMIHTVFIGDGEDYPAILDNLALTTGGSRFQAVRTRPFRSPPSSACMEIAPPNR